MGGIAAPFSPDGKWLITEFLGHNDFDVNVPAAWKKITLWEVATGNIFKTFASDYRGEEPQLLAFLPDGKRAISAGRGFWMLFEIPEGKVIRQVNSKQGMVMPSDLSQDGKRLLSYGSLSGMDGLQLWDVDSGTVSWFTFTDYPISGGRLSPDGTQALVQGGPRGIRTGDDHVSLQLWSFAQGRPMLPLQSDYASWWCPPFDFSPNGKQFLACLASHNRAS
jgi:WD40 repeat protein